MDTLYRTKKLILLGLLCSVFVVALIVLFSPTPTYQPHGVFLPAKNMQKLAATQPKDVMVIRQFPAEYKKLGVINVEMHVTKNSLAEMKALSNYVRSLAAKHGANAVVGDLFKSEPQGPEKGMSAYIFRGAAIKAE